MTYKIKALPENERPRERLLSHGPESLATSELIAIILGSGMKGKSVLQLASELISIFGSPARLVDASIEELCEIKGLGQAKAIQLKAALNLGMKAAKQEHAASFHIDNPVHVYNLVKDEMEREKRERFVAVLLDAKGQLIRQETISIGTLSETLVHPREVFYPAIRHKAASMILVHNHPSGDPTPSEEDLDLTRDLLQAANLMDIPINDHIIIGKGGYTSLRQRGGLGF